MTGYINTMKDLEAQAYGLTSAFGGNDILKQAGVVQGLHTAHDFAGGVASGTTSVDSSAMYNVLYGQKVWSMLNREVNVLSMIAKRPYTTSGWRVLKSRPFGGSGNTLAESLLNDSDASDSGIGSDTPAADAIGGVPENAGLSTAADGLGSMAPTYAQLFMSPKIVAHQFDFSELAMEMAKIDDGIGDIRAQMRKDMGIAHAESQNMMLVMPLEHYGEQANTSTGRLENIERNYTSLNKIVTSRAEILAIDGGVIATDTATAANQLGRIYGDERFSAASFLDSTVNFNDAYTSSDVRPLTLTVVNTSLRQLREAGGTPKVILTGYDTIQAMADLLQSQERFMDRKEIIPTVNGVRGVKGAEVGFRVATYYDIPLIPVKDMASTGNGATKISDMLLLDTDHIWLAVMKPTQYFEDGISNGNPFGVGRLGNQAIYRTIGEVGCSFFKGQGKITNLQ